jgi:hypothetical protein
MRFHHLRTVISCLLLLCSSSRLSLAQETDHSLQDESAPWLTPSVELDDRLPSWLQFSGEERARAEGNIGIGFKDSTDRYLLNRLRLNMKVKPTTWLNFNFQAQDARSFWREEAQKPPYRDPWDLTLAYLELGGLEKYHATFCVGRQDLSFGDERLIGVSNWTNTGRSYDGYRIAVQYQKVRIDAFAASVVVFPGNDIGYHTPGNYIEGLYAAVDHLPAGMTVQPYFLWRRSPGVKLGNGSVGTEDFGTTGVRWTGKIVPALSFNTETALQRGSLKTDTVAAWATHLQGKLDLPFWKSSLHPAYVAEFNYASGDKNRKDGTHSTFDTLYASGHDKIDLADQAAWKNIREFRTGMDFRLSKRYKLMTRYADLWLANAHDSLYASNGAASVTSADGSAGNWVGQEFDGTITMSVKKSSQLGAGYGYLLPGTFLKKTTSGDPFMYPFLFYQTSF